MTKRDFAIAAISLLISAIFCFGYVKQHETQTNVVVGQFLENATEATAVQQDLVDNHRDAYNELAQCQVVDPAHCDRNTSARTLEQLKTQRESLKARLKALNQAADALEPQLRRAIK